MTIVRPFGSLVPAIAPNAFLADGVVVIGEVMIGEDASIWYGCVLRGDMGYVRVGARSNIQDLSLCHMTHDDTVVEIGEEVTVGHHVIIHGARIDDGALVGMGSVLLDGVVVGEEALVAAGTLLPPRTMVPPRTLVRGHPGKVVRDLGPEEWIAGRDTARRYAELARKHALIRAQPPPTK
ncbi:MAG: gamma carbonic anhydrase family protein [Polyangiaceae bacterium]|nr:gamma carbonic anhydrase family protein [Polyangiaceae bacterium]